MTNESANGQSTLSAPQFSYALTSQCSRGDGAPGQRKGSACKRAGSILNDSPNVTKKIARAHTFANPLEKATVHLDVRKIASDGGASDLRCAGWIC